MSNFEETETVRVLNMLFPGKENIFNDVLGWDPVHMVSHLRFQTDQEFIDDFYNTLSNSDDEYAQKIFRKIKTDIDTIIYKYLKDNAYDTSVPDELKIELDGTKFLLSFLEGAIYTVDKRFRTVYGSKFTYLPYLFYEDIKVVVEERGDSVDIGIYQREYLVETHRLKPVLVVDEVKPLDTRPPEVDILNRVFKDTNFHRSFMEWVNKDQVLTPYYVKFLVVTFLFTYSNQEIVDDFYNTFSKISWCDIHDEDVEFVCSINREIGKMLYRKLEPYAYERNREKYELKIKLVGIEFLFTFTDFTICTLNKKYHVDYFPRFKGVQHMFGKDTRVSIQNLKLTADLIILNIYYGESSEMYTLGYNEFDDTPVENIWDTANRIQELDSFILNYDENQSVLKFFVNYKLTEEEIQNGRIKELNGLAYPDIKFLTNLEEFTGIGDGEVLCEVIYKIICRFQDKLYKINGKFIAEYIKEEDITPSESCKIDISKACPFYDKDDESQESYRRCDNDYGEYKSEHSDVDSVKEYREATELHTKIKEISGFYSRKRIFRDKFNSDGIITKKTLPEDVKQRIFAKFDDLSDRFTDKYEGVRSFLPYQYIFFKFLLEEGYEYPLVVEGYEYPYRYTEEKYKAMEELYWSVKDPKDYSNFINFLKSPTECENFEIYDTPKKVVIQRSLSRGNTTAYVLTVKGDFDLALQYFTKVLPKSGKNPEYRYNLFILEMQDKLKLETISLNDVINYMISYVINELMYFAVEL